MMQQIEIEETLLKHAQIANEQAGIAEKHTDILLQITNAYFELLEKVGQQKCVIVAQGKLLNQCMERIMQLEGRSIIGSFNQRIEQLESRMVSMPSTHELGKLEKRIEDLESWLYTHDYAYFQQEENESGNSSFEEHEQGIADNAQLEQLGTHPPNCFCPYCASQEGEIEHETL